MRLIAFALLLPLLLAACDAPEDMPADVDLSEAQIVALSAYATDLLDSLQVESFEQEKEVCGYILMDEEGAFSHTGPHDGDVDSCDPGYLSSDIVASYHTHGSFDPDYNSETPSSDDLLGDFEVGIDGYVSTPGGRIWRISHEDRVAYKLCGPGCVVSDPDEDPAFAETFPEVLTLDEIRALE